ncbi:MAG TPA: fibro-slime domain-containing protein [Polyangiaceae bacterium]|nr:fibro-slime domain-containing protein [Polyangiaceae bacterium]
MPTDDACSGKLPVVYRDFSQAHPDFEMAFSGDVVRRQLVAATLGADHTPTFASSTGCPWKQGTPTACDNWKTDKLVINSADSFSQWYHDTPNVNIHFDKTLVLTEDPPGSGTYTYNSTQFFPLGNDEGFGVTPAGAGHNFLFTTEIHLTFAYVKGQKFTFHGDDDMWIFVNNKLALDLGSMHAAADGTIDFDAQAADLGIVPSNVYPMDIFHAERHTSASNFGVETNIACFTPSVVH